MDLLVLGIIIGAGILIGIPTGPARFFVVDTRLQDGKTAAIKTYLGFFLAVLVYAGIALLADDYISRHEKVRIAAHLAASVLLVLWGLLIIIKSRKSKNSSLDFSFKSSFLKGLAAGLSSPVSPFIYLAFMQTLRIYADELTLWNKALAILLFECTAFLTTWGVAALLKNKKQNVRSKWTTVKICMGILLISIGTYQASQRLSFKDGIQIQSSKSSVSTAGIHD